MIGEPVVGGYFYEAYLIRMSGCIFPAVLDGYGLVLGAMDNGCLGSRQDRGGVAQSIFMKCIA